MGKNPVAKALSEKQNQPRVKPDKTKYNRKKKGKNDDGPKIPRRQV